ncbi:DUF6893 family small protein [Gordonia rhizosphera]
MRRIGQLATLVAVATVVAVVIIGIRSVPDVQRYLRMRRM